MQIHLFKTTYPSGYTRGNLTLNEAIRLINGRAEIIFSTHRTVSIGNG